MGGSAESVSRGRTRTEELRAWRFAGACLSCGAARGGVDDGHYCSRCAGVLTHRYFVRIGEPCLRCVAGDCPSVERRLPVLEDVRLV